MKMNEHQQRLWGSMIDLIDSYLNNENQAFYEIVGKLEGALDASEIKNNELVNQWYDFWTPLEIRRAVEGKEVNRAKAVEELKAMKEFLLKNLFCPSWTQKLPMVRCFKLRPAIFTFFPTLLHRWYLINYIPKREET